MPTGCGATLESYDDPNIYCAVEMGMGMNPNARVGASSSLEDEAELGTMHIGIGNGITFGSSIRAKGHCDLVMGTQSSRSMAGRFSRTAA